MNIVEVRNLSKIFIQGETEIKAVDNMSFDIAEGELLAITGQSGSGKTTLMNLIGGIEKPTNGQIIIDGIDICQADERELARLRRQKIGYVFQDFNLIPILSVEENIIMPLLLDSKKMDKKRFNKIVGFLGLENRLNHLPSQLSGGQKQRVAIARALINNPGIILADVKWSMVFIVYCVHSVQKKRVKGTVYTSKLKFVYSVSRIKMSRSRQKGIPGSLFLLPKLDKAIQDICELFRIAFTLKDGIVLS